MATGWIRARAPATIANLGPGFDVFALAIRGLADEVAVRPAEHDSLRVQGVDAADIPSTFSGNTAGIVIEALRAATGITQSLEVRVTKGIPSGRGLGSSAASCAAAALAFLRAFPKSRDLGIAGVLRTAVEGEAAVSGRHYDNLAAALLGGFVTLGSSEPVLVSRIPVNPRIALAIAIPRFVLRTADMRGILPSVVPLRDAVSNVGHAAIRLSPAIAWRIGSQSPCERRPCPGTRRHGPRAKGRPPRASPSAAPGPASSPSLRTGRSRATWPRRCAMGSGPRAKPQARS